MNVQKCLINENISWYKGTTIDASLLDENAEESTVIPSQLTTTDIQMSLLNTDKFV